MTVTVAPAPLESVLELIADWSPVALDAAGTAADRDTWKGVTGIEGAPLAVGPDALQALAWSFHRVFLGETPPERRAALNDLIAAVGPRPRLGPDGHGWEIADRADAQVAALILALWRHADGDPDLARLGTCAAHRCLDPYVDATQASNRRFCSVTCQNRAKVAAYRQRQRGIVAE
jgi:CGNR zinc finger